MEMAYCHEHAIAHSTFLEWPEEDRAKLQAYILEKALRCTMCGTADWEWDPAEGGSRHAYMAVDEVCHGCEKKDLLRTDPEREDRPGVSVTLIPEAAAAALLEATTGR